MSKKVLVVDDDPDVRLFSVTVLEENGYTPLEAEDGEAGLKMIKEEKPELADKEMEVFSDFVWEKVLSKANYLEHFSADSLNLFKCGEEAIHRIVVKVNKEGINLLESKDFEWLLDNSKDPRVEYLKGKKGYSQERNLEIFDLIQKGSVVSDGKLFEAIHSMISAQSN